MCSVLPGLAASFQNVFLVTFSIEFFFFTLYLLNSLYFKKGLEEIGEK